ncbi:MAG: hypothetical protein D6736_08600, partial [Nitrospinota bacterium]
VWSGEASTPEEDLKEILHTLRTIETRLQAIEKKLDLLWSLRPDFATLMPEFSERFHVLHFAGEAGDWATAGHEFLQMKRVAEQLKAIDPQRGVLLESFLAPFFTGMQEIIADGDRARFLTLLDQTTALCNSCHAAVGSPFIKVSLQPTVSLRHPHIFTPSQMAAGHKHGHEAMEEEKEEHHEEEEKGHHEEEHQEKDKHTP